MKNPEHAGEYIPAGEESGIDRTFGMDEVAKAFNVDPERVQRAFAGEFGPHTERVDSKGAQHLAEVILGDEPMDQQIAALMTLGAFTPRPDHIDGLGEKDPEEESDKLPFNEDDETPRGPEADEWVQRDPNT